MSKTPEINRLVLNGCSYMENYADGNGHKELADKFNISNVKSLARAGSSNERIFRTTLDDCYNNEKTLYVIGLTFVHRYELPILSQSDPWNIEHHEGDKFQWINNENLIDLGQLDSGITENDVKQFHKLKTKFDVNSQAELVFKSVYYYTSLVDSILNNGHQVVVFNTAETIFESYTNDPKLKYLEKYNKYIIKQFNWYSNEYQLNNGASIIKEDIDVDMPTIYKHIAPGEHKKLNEFLYDHISNNFYV